MIQDARDSYSELLKRSRERTILGSCASLLGWDEQTYLPTGGADHRGEQMALLAGLVHERATDPKLGDLLDTVEGSGLFTGDTPEAANIRELRRGYRRQMKLPRSLVEELARVTSVGQHEWVEAKKAKNFGQLRPTLETIFGLKRQEAECLAESDVLYDALIDEYEPGAKSRDLAQLFGAFRAELVPLVGAIGASNRRPDTSILKRDYPVNRQKMYGEMVASAVGFDFHRGRLDTTEHPFCTGIGPSDTRITTRYDPRNFSDSFFGILHEVGHGLYDQGLDPARYGTPCGDAVSLGIHESQSRLWENVVGRSRPFWMYWFPLAKQVFREALSDVDFDAFHFAINEVKPSLVRVQADEVTYNLHILIRFELEHALLSGDLTVADLPGAWTEKYRTYLGIVPSNDAEGCLQDIHWSAGLIGYFPTYTLGNLYAAQFFATANQELGDLTTAFVRGDYGGLLGWLRAKIHTHGQRYLAVNLARRVTGEPTDHKPLMAALSAKYGELYEL